MVIIVLSLLEEIVQVQKFVRMDLHKFSRPITYISLAQVGCTSGETYHLKIIIKDSL
jgi:hypothetical protein